MREVISILVALLSLSYVESRYCTYFTSDGYVHTITCQPYEFCCGNACCRSGSFKFYQFWYFWLSVILILLMCSGGSWWYRLRYRNQFYTPHYPTSIYGASDQRHHPGVMYYATVDRVLIPQAPKNLDFCGQVVAPPSYAQANANGPLGFPNPSGPTPPPPPPVAFDAGPPPPYEVACDRNNSVNPPNNTNTPQPPPTERSHVY